MSLNRRQWLGRLAAGAAGLALPARRAAAAPQEASKPGEACPLALKDFQPKSMLHVPETNVARARFPVIDVHTHLSWAAQGGGGVFRGEEMKFLATPAELLEVMDRKNVRTMVNLTGGNGAGLEKSIRYYESAAPGRFVTFTEPSWARLNEPGYPQWQADEIERAKKAGARGVKVLKTLGLFLRENVTSGPLVKIDDRRFDPMWDACGRLGMPVAIHISDPEAFFLPTDRFNERYEELSNHPDWSFHDRDFPSNAELLAARNRMFARHPNTRFIVLHVGNNAENLASVSEHLDGFPNNSVEMGARVGELGRQPRASRRFFDKYQDRILFGTDAVPKGYETPQQIFGEALYEIYYRFLETEDEYFDYAPAPVPPQGRWRIYGIGLPDAILKKVYHDNAARLLGLPA
ncbi:MAG TPA: amidohydrolase family protein [Vicinamibacteria bacterium]|jgi:predicted TIM-barrel fold metal-dependent hydrolase|nr:amidohydrolase family protein [Vicinamibacteria bacterium]